MNEMASSGRKKLDEYHLKILRELLTQPPNKYCFDCHQRGPTYVNVTIGSFVCTTCSGILRGLTPPHRVKSVTMATFSPEEMELIKTRGNEYCRKIWLGLYDNEVPTNDEQQIKDFMISKYEKKRYYIDPSTASMLNGSLTPSSISSNSSSNQNSPLSHNLSDTSSGKIRQQELQSQQPRPNTLTSTPNNTHQPFVADFSSSFSSNANSSNSSETSFADFENNPVFNSPSQSAASTVWPNYGNIHNVTASIHPSLVQTAAINSFKEPPLNPLTRPSSVPINKCRSKEIGSALSSHDPPPEDKYAALKDLDCLMKSEMLEKQKQQLLQQNLTNGNLWPSVFPTISNGTVSEPVTPFNPFAGAGSWLQQKSYDINPFAQTKFDGWSNDNAQWKMPNNFSFSHGQNMATVSNNWITNHGNPFKVNTWSQSNGQHHSSNPFL